MHDENVRQRRTFFNARSYIPEQREMGFDRGKVWIAPDFDDPLPDDVLAELER
ncbi:MAG: hypothetical protein ABR593_09400 [Candidatus Limnocylindria bacterium]